MSTTMHNQEQSHLALFPPELLQKVLSFVRDDDIALGQCQKVCKLWQQTILGSVFYREKCEIMLDRNPSLRPTFKLHNFEENKLDPRFCRTFYKKLSLLKDRWRGSGLADVRVIDCLNSTTPDGKRVEISEEWRKRHNYTGVYDMVWDEKNSLLSASVFNTIQVWDMTKYEVVSILGSDVLDSGTQASCFFSADRTLACGTEKGIIKVFDLMTGEQINEARHGNAYICDIKIYGRTLMAIDWFGDVQEWSLGDEGSREVRFSKEIHPVFDIEEEVTAKYRERCWERLLDFNDKVIVTNGRGLLVVFSRDNGAKLSDLYVFTSAQVMCCKLFGMEVFWGEQNGYVYRGIVVEGEQVFTADAENCSRLLHYRAYLGDNITSLDVNSKHVIFGDVNGDIHCLNKELFGQKDCLKFVIETGPDSVGHKYGSYVWTTHMDESRIFSGDSDGKLVVHDFWDYSDK